MGANAAPGRAVCKREGAWKRDEMETKERLGVKRVATTNKVLPRATRKHASGDVRRWLWVPTTKGASILINEETRLRW